MARARNIKPGLFKNEVLGVADPLYTLLFEGLWLLADRDGRLEDRPLRIKAEIFPYREGLDMVGMLSWLVQAGFVLRYSANGLPLIQILQFAKHQNPHKNEPESVYPGPDVAGSHPEEIGTAPADPGFLTPDPGLIENCAAAPSTRSRKKSTLTPIPDDFCVSERVQKWADRKGFGRLQEHLEAFTAKAKAKAYSNASWDDAFMEAIREDWAKLRGRTKDGSPPAGEHATTATNPAAMFKAEPALTPQQLAANKAKADQVAASLGIPNMKVKH